MTIANTRDPRVESQKTLEAMMYDLVLKSLS